MAGVFIFGTIALTVIGQLLIKLGASGAGEAHRAASPIAALSSPLVLGGLVCAAAAAICWIGAVSRCPLSFAYPFMGLAIVLVLALSPIVLAETVPANRWIGVIIVCVGIFVASWR